MSNDTKIDWFGLIIIGIPGVLILSTVYPMMYLLGMVKAAAMRGWRKGQEIIEF